VNTIFSDFNLYSINVSVTNRRGILLYVDCNLSSCQLDICQEFDDFIFVKVCNGTEFQITLGGFYRSPNSNLVNDNKLLSLLDSLKCQVSGKLLLIGDFNFANIN